VGADPQYSPWILLQWANSVRGIESGEMRLRVARADLQSSLRAPGRMSVARAAAA
jgi:hypothetical protein